ncbi:hypothetical protein [Nocardia farcinica]|uniref:hypothetical protein n=1 Tax=Nocardia farcinica TaxID=37329 RepID=UPI00189637B0|nr:hypothetical protein [Nocardia farcinica]MBF6267562.1 hypothetical protein [Nocardia farcinica]MCZ9327039.1 hypothetical protein [Nocardia farcinica]
MDAGYGAAAVWVADVVQGRLAGLEFVQWPSSGFHPLVPRLVGPARRSPPAHCVRTATGGTAGDRARRRAGEQG